MTLTQGMLQSFPGPLSIFQRVYIPTDLAASFELIMWMTLPSAAIFAAQYWDRKWFGRAKVFILFVTVVAVVALGLFSRDRIYVFEKSENCPEAGPSGYVLIVPFNPSYEAQKYLVGGLQFGKSRCDTIADNLQKTYPEFEHFTISYYATTLTYAAVIFFSAFGIYSAFIWSLIFLLEKWRHLG